MSPRLSSQLSPQGRRVSTIITPSTFSYLILIGRCAFEIVEPSRGIFSVVGGATRHYYKAESEEELVDWMIAIKKHIPESKIEINEST